MTKIKYNDFDIKKLSLGKAIPIKSENKITGYFIPIHGPKTVGTKVDSVFFQTPLLNTKFEKAKYSDKNTQMILSISNIEALVVSEIIAHKTEIFTKKVPSDNIIKKNFKNIVNTADQTVRFPFDLPNGENIVSFGIRGIILQGNTICLDLTLIDVHTLNNSKPLEVLGMSEDSENDTDSEFSENFEFDD